MMMAPTLSPTQMFVHRLTAHISIIMHTPELRMSVNILVHATTGVFAKIFDPRATTFALTFKLGDSFKAKAALNTYHFRLYSRRDSTILDLPNGISYYRLNW